MINSNEIRKAFLQRLYTVVPKSDISFQNIKFDPKGKALWVAESFISGVQGFSTTDGDSLEAVFQYTINVPVSSRRGVTVANDKSIEIGNLWNTAEVVTTTNYKTSIDATQESFRGRLDDKWYSIVIDINVKIYEVDEAEPPIFTGVPTINGGYLTGDVITGANATYIGTEPIVYTYQWFRDSAPIVGATNSSYTLTDDDADTSVKRKDTITSIHGENTAESNAISAKRLWTPGDMTTDLWLDAGDASTLPDGAGPTSTWMDKSGNSNTASQATGVAQPVYSTDNMNFNGSQYMTTPVIPFEDKVTFSFMLNTQTHVTYARIINALNDGVDGLFISWNGTATNQLFIRAQNGSTFGPVLNTDCLNTNSIIIIEFNGSTCSVCQDGSFVQSGTINQVVAATSVLSICSDPNGLDAKHDGDLNEIVAINNIVTTADRERIEGYKAWKWDAINGNTNLVDALPISHTYKSIAPIYTP